MMTIGRRNGRTLDTLPQYMVAMLLLVAFVLGAPCVTPKALAQPADYGTLYSQGNDHYQNGRLTEAIAAYEKAVPLAQDNSIPIAYNNLAAIYMKRGNYFLNAQKDAAKALNDFEMAVYYLDVGWPEGLEYSDSQRNNRKIALSNLAVGHQRMGIGANVQAHSQRASQLRLQGQFRQAATEYASALGVSQGQDTASMKALGDLFLVLGDAHKAKKYYRQLVEAAPNTDTDTRLRLANAEYQSGDIDSAIARLNAITEESSSSVAALRQLEQIWRTELKYSPQNPLVHANLASVFQKQRVFDKALQAYTNAEQLASRTPGFRREDSHDIRLNMGTLYREMSQPKLAQQAFESVLREDPANERGLLLLGLLQRDTGHPADAVRTFEVALSKNPGNTEIAEELLDTLTAHPDVAEKQRQLELLGQRFTNNSAIQQTVAERLHAMGQPALAIPYYQRALVLNPNQAALHANLATALQATGDTPQSLQHLERARQLDPNNAVVKELAEKTRTSLWQATYAQVLEAQQANDTRKALGLYQQVIQLAQQTGQPLTDELHANYGLALQANGQQKEAIERYNQAIALSPKAGLWRYYRATAYHQLQQLPMAQRDYEDALDDAGLEATVRKAIGDSLEQMSTGQFNALLQDAIKAYEKKQYPQALQILDKVDALKAEQPYSAYYRGLIFDEQGQTAKAIGAYKQAISRDAEMTDAYYGLALAYDTAGQPTEAKTQYQLYLDKMGKTVTETTQYAQQRIKVLTATPE